MLYIFKTFQYTIETDTYMPPTPTEIYQVQITQFELYHVYPKFTPTGQKIYQV